VEGLNRRSEERDEYLSTWQQQIASPTEARGVLGTVLDDRIVFAPDAAHHRYTLTLPIAFDRMLSTVVPEWKGQLQELLASPSGMEDFYTLVGSAVRAA
jgi:hypothetical protein